MSTSTKSAAKSVATKSIEFHIIVAVTGQLLGRIFIPNGMKAGVPRKAVFILDEKTYGDGGRVMIFSGSTALYLNLLEKFPSSSEAFREASIKHLAAVLERAATCDIPDPWADEAAAEPTTSECGSGRVDDDTDELDLPECKSPSEMERQELIDFCLSLGAPKSIGKRGVSHMLTWVEKKLSA